MQHDLPFEPSSSSLSPSPVERDEGKHHHHSFDHHDLMNVNSYLPPSFIQPAHQPATSDISMLHSPLPSPPPNMNSASLPTDQYFQKPNEGMHWWLFTRCVHFSPVLALLVLLIRYHCPFYSCSPFFYYLASQKFPFFLFNLMQNHTDELNRRSLLCLPPPHLLHPSHPP